ncbi:helix-turn-helix domain-containing protein [Pseudomonas syringae]|uniref:helix-turn-helix domain-containing protein n=1 Tax=Pseudomonas syringae TaxID=317 RepID=UPI000362D0C5|nr:helix-turn-helix transcriptional regulator [Pseudomonas syringae]
MPKEPVAKDTGTGKKPARPRVSASSKKSPKQTAEVTLDKHRKKPVEGRRLINLIKKTMIDRDLHERAIADITGVTQIYWNSMANGNRQIKSLGKDKLDKIAEFLDLPLIQVLILADYFVITDFFNGKTLNDQLLLTLRKMQEDPQWAGYAPDRDVWEATDLGFRTAFAVMYEQISGNVLMEKAKFEVPGMTRPKD